MRIAALMMQKNEGELLRAWVLYHSRLFGAENLFILDNYSTDLATIAALDLAENMGANVKRDIDNFQRKGIYFSDMIASMSNMYDVFFPLDCDEFVCVLKNDRVSSDRDEIDAELARLISSPCLIRISKAILNVPHTNGGYISSGMKIAVAGKEDTRLDMGFHLYDFVNKSPTVDPELIVESQLAHMHFHYKTFPELLKSARAKLKSRIPSFDRETLQSYRGTGYHVAGYFLISEADYLERLPKPEIDLTEHFAKVGIEVPFSQS